MTEEEKYKYLPRFIELIKEKYKGKRLDSIFFYHERISALINFGEFSCIACIYKIETDELIETENY